MLPSKTEYPFWHSYSVMGHNWASVTYCEFNYNLVITRLTHEQRLGVCGHEIKQIMEFAKNMYGVKYRKCPT